MKLKGLILKYKVVLKLSLAKDKFAIESITNHAVCSSRIRVSNSDRCNAVPRNAESTDLGSLPTCLRR